MNDKYDSHKTADEVWRDFTCGDKEALDYLYNDHIISLYNYGRKITEDEELIKDCIQDLFLDLWRNKVNLQQPHSIRFYLLKALRYKITYQLKKENNKTFPQHFYTEYTYRPVPSYEATLIAHQLSQEQQEKLRKGIEKLSQRQREAIVLKFYEDFTYEEIASLMSLKPQSVYNLIYKAIATLKKNLIVEISFLLLLASTMLMAM